MKSILLRSAILLLILMLSAACGGSGGGDSSSTACTPNGNIRLLSSSTGTILLSSITVTALHSTSSVTPVPVYVGYTPSLVGEILAGYPPGGTNPATVGINIAQIGPSTVNPVQMSVTFDANRTPATNHATLRFVAVDTTLSKVEGCQDLPVTFTIQ